MNVGLFPGQGIKPEVLIKALPPKHALLTSAEELLGYDLRARIEADVRRSGSPLSTAVVQPATFVAGLIAWERAEGASCDLLLGHSLGEYTALVAAGAMSFEHGLAVVQVRAEAMEAAGRALPGGMVAVLGLDLAEVEDIARATGTVVANDNAPGQAVVSGSEAALDEVGMRVTAVGGRAIRLPLSGRFHSLAMASAANALRDALDHVWISTPAPSVIANISARPYRAPGEIRALLVEQLTGRVRFREALQWAWSIGVENWIDFGPGEVVGGLARRTFGTLADRGVSVDA